MFSFINSKSISLYPGCGQDLNPLFLGSLFNDEQALKTRSTMKRAFSSPFLLVDPSPESASFMDALQENGKNLLEEPPINEYQSLYSSALLNGPYQKIKLTGKTKHTIDELVKATLGKTEYQCLELNFEITGKNGEVFTNTGYFFPVEIQELESFLLNWEGNITTICFLRQRSRSFRDRSLRRKLYTIEQVVDKLSSKKEPQFVLTDQFVGRSQMVAFSPFPHLFTFRGDAKRPQGGGIRLYWNQKLFDNNTLSDAWIIPDYIADHPIVDTEADHHWTEFNYPDDSGSKQGRRQRSAPEYEMHSLFREGHTLSFEHLDKHERYLYIMRLAQRLLR